MLLDPASAPAAPLSAARAADVRVCCAGPGTSLQFALKIVERLYGQEKADFLAAQMLTTLA